LADPGVRVTEGRKNGRQGLRIAPCSEPFNAPSPHARIGIGYRLPWGLRRAPLSPWGGRLRGKRSRRRGYLTPEDFGLHALNPALRGVLDEKEMVDMGQKATEAVKEGQLGKLHRHVRLEGRPSPDLEPSLAGHLLDEAAQRYVLRVHTETPFVVGHRQGFPG